MLHLYIDTNVYLTFYHLSSDDLDELLKIKVLIKNKKLQLHLPEQTLDEFNRNRETKIADALRRFKEEKLNNQFPQICKSYPEFEKLKSLLKDFEVYKSKLIKSMTEDIFKRNLTADKIINELFSLARIYQIDDHVINLAKNRFDLGKPPGKNKSYGDALNWESLLRNIKHGEDLYFVSDDRDYYSEIDSTYFNDYLLQEWERIQESNLYHFRRISDFFKTKFPEIHLASEMDKDFLINELTIPKTFAASRSTLYSLSKYADFSVQQLNDIAMACATNNQIYWIRDDSDIKKIIHQIIDPNRDKIDPSILAKFDAIYVDQKESLKTLAGSGII